MGGAIIEPVTEPAASRPGELSLGASETPADQGVSCHNFLKQPSIRAISAMPSRCQCRQARVRDPPGLRVVRIQTGSSIERSDRVSESTGRENIPWPGRNDARPAALGGLLTTSLKSWRFVQCESALSRSLVSAYSMNRPASTGRQQWLAPAVGEGGCPYRAARIFQERWLPRHRQAGHQRIMIGPAEAPYRVLDLYQHPPHPRPMGGHDPHLGKHHVLPPPAAREVEVRLAPQLHRPPIDFREDPAVSAGHVNRRHRVGMHRPPVPPELVAHPRVQIGRPLAQRVPRFEARR